MKLLKRQYLLTVAAIALTVGGLGLFAHNNPQVHLFSSPAVAGGSNGGSNGGNGPAPGQGNPGPNGGGSGDVGGGGESPCPPGTPSTPSPPSSPPGGGAPSRSIDWVNCDGEFTWGLQGMAKTWALKMHIPYIAGVTGPQFTAALRQASGASSASQMAEAVYEAWGRVHPGQIVDKCKLWDPPAIAPQIWHGKPAVLAKHKKTGGSWVDVLFGRLY